MADTMTPSLRILAGSDNPGESGTKLLDRASAFTFLEPGRVVETSYYLWGADEMKEKTSSKIGKIEQELQAACDKIASLESDMKFVQKELQGVILLEDVIAEVEREAQEDTTVVIPSMLCLAKLFHSIATVDDKHVYTEVMR
ncbi:unnamed protein product [Ranitomeya imitator]|uniref:Uncharacterized protein n=1 Tax=Ranitomeya imitator TaxID=111125 RepID=A0ABN9M0U0_9NEOB|nr:unnamed protein product [Ranitomeya imitator]